MRRDARTMLLQRLADQFAAASADGSEVHRTSAFAIHLWRSPDPFYRNVAVPRCWPVDWPTAIEEMRRLMIAHGRMPRLEYFAELWPGLGAHLTAHGFALEAVGQVMACGRNRFRSGPAPDPAVLLDAATPPAVLRACLEGAAGAFGSAAVACLPEELERLRDGLARGSIRSAAVLCGGEVAAAASLIGADAVRELAGVWTAAAHRRRGFAAAVCRRLLAAFFAMGGKLAWLSAGSDASVALYHGLGFAPAGTQLNYVWQPPDRPPGETCP